MLSLLVQIISIAVISLKRCIFPPSDDTVSNRVILITGTAHGIGRELALQYGKLGAIVVCVDINDKQNEQTVHDLKKQGIKAYAYTCNVIRKEEVMELSKRVLEDFREVNILVNNAGILVSKALIDLSEEDVYNSFNVNIISQFWMLQAFLPALKKSRTGHVIAISSLAGLQGQGNAAAYSATKYAVRGLMEAAAEEARHNGWKIRFTTICPFFVNTGMCKQPKIRFRSIADVLTTEEVAHAIIEAQRLNLQEVSVPRSLRPAVLLLALMPAAATAAIRRFLGFGIGTSP